MAVGVEVVVVVVVVDDGGDAGAEVDGGRAWRHLISSRDAAGEGFEREGNTARLLEDSSAVSHAELAGTAEVFDERLDKRRRAVGATNWEPAGDELWSGHQWGEKNPFQKTAATKSWCVARSGSARQRFENRTR